MIAFPTRSLDLINLSYFVFPYLKDTRHNTIKKLGNVIVNSWTDIPTQTLTNVIEIMKRRVQLCLQNNNQHF